MTLTEQTREPMEFPHETIERKARHFVRWHPTVAARLASFGSLLQLANRLAGKETMWDYTALAKQLFAALEERNVKYLVIGGYAARAYGVPRFTDDVDLFVENTTANIQQVLTALAALGSDQAEICQQLQQTIVIRLEIDDLPLKTDILVNVPGRGAYPNNWTAKSSTSSPAPILFKPSAPLVAGKIWRM